MALSRRRFLTSATATGLAISLGYPRSAQAWGAISDPLVRGPIPVDGYKILEVFLYGGVSPWETFYVRTGIADPFFGLDTQVADLDWNASCSGVSSPANQTLAFGADAIGPVAWGPATKPLWRTDIFGRVRMVVHRHNLEPHEAAIPYALTGHVLGRPNFSGLGAAISHRFASTAHPLPFAYSFLPGAGVFGTDNFQGMHATGTHGGEFRPLSFLMGPSAGSLLGQLQRNGMTSQADDLLRFYRAAYGDKLRWNSDLTRSKGFEAYNAGLDNLLSAPALNALLTPAPLTPPTGAHCASFLPTMPPSDTIVTRASILTAAYLLSQPLASGGARYAGVVDGGILHPGGAGYDTHGDNTRATAINLWSTCQALADVIDPNSPPAAGKISLNDTLVVVKTEFGRTPTTGTGTGAGRDHWPQGYVCALIGGPVTARGIAGSIGAAGADRGHAVALDHYTASEFHAATMLAADIFPFESENFGIGDMSAKTRGPTEEITAQNIRTQVLGA
ncbi:MAG: DUF1501 domain-containing protein [Gammaproteobacteria bacterium]